MKLLRNGMTRWVFLAGSYAIKVPAPWEWRLFLKGLLANIQERDCWRWTAGSSRLCPVLWAAWGGWLLVMRRASAINEQPAEADLADFREAGWQDLKVDNFGTLQGRLVLVDYGS